MMAGRPKGIPFIRAYPNGDYVMQTIERPGAIDFMAGRFIANGGRYFIAVMNDGDVRMDAAIAVPDGTLHTLATEQVENGPEVVEAVDRLVRESIRHLDAVQ